MNNAGALWDRHCEEKFFIKSLEITAAEKLFYDVNKRLIAYWPKSYEGATSTLQSRNAYIGNFTEKWVAELISGVLPENLYAISGVECADLGLTSQSAADIVISKSNSKKQNSKDILVIFEVKMSIVWNWELQNSKLQCLGDYKTHRGNPSLLRSDSMLKAIGKSINIRTSSEAARHIPIVIIGNTPITENYYEKVDHLKMSGIIQNVWSLNPCPLDEIADEDNLKETEGKGFLRFDSLNELEYYVKDLLSCDLNFFSSMKTKEEIGKYITIACEESTNEMKAIKFLSLLK
ncbi:hypothetical protein AGMMS49990_05770 [Endomicrobiia bacterium]|nr:hypothetical protein AGMMS49990_05770 [Endomicrobiia bacterium]